MSQDDTSARAVGWLEQQLTELTGIRNATARDPSFKNWRQNTLTVMQRIWPGDQLRTERFRRIPFSPADPRADARTLREWYSRGCQEAARVVRGLMDEARREGVPALGPEAMPAAAATAFQDDFPTVDLPEGELGEAMTELPAPAPPAAPPAPVADAPHGAGAPPGLRIQIPASALPPGAHPAAPSGQRPAKKGLNVAAKLRDLLGFAGLSAKVNAAPEPAPAPDPAPAPENPPAAGAPGAPGLGIVAVGDEIVPRRKPAPPQQPVAPAAPSARTVPAQPASPASPPAAPTEPQPPVNEGMSVVMSRPTTLRGAIGKVSIESLISPEFRGGTEAAATSPGPAPVTPAPRSSRTDPPASRPPLSLVPPLSRDPEFNVDPDRWTSPSEADELEPAPTPATRSSEPANVVPLPAPDQDPDQDSRIAGALAGTPAGTTAGAPAEDDEALDDDDAFDMEPADPALPGAAADPDEVARATEDFMRTSPVLGATGRKVQRPFGEDSYRDADAIAVAGMVDDLAALGVPTARHAETRARLADLARRLESGDLEWGPLRKAVWFAMEYPEVARRLMPVLLPWIDRAA